MASKSKRKGDRYERKLVEAFRGLGLDAHRVPLSGAVEGYKGDVRVQLGPGCVHLSCEVKARRKAAGFKTVKGWLGSNALLALYEDGREPLMVMPWSLFCTLFGRLPTNAAVREAGPVPASDPAGPPGW